VIIRGRDGQNVELHAFALSDMTRWGYQSLRNIGGGGIGEKEMRGIPAIHRAARLRAEAVAQMRLACWRGDGPARVRVETPWQAKLFRGRPNAVQSRFGFWETVEESLAYRGNGYIWKNFADGRMGDWWALHPDQVDPRPDGTFRVTVAAGYVDPVGKGPGVYTVGPDVILHIRGHGQGGQLVAPSPIEVFKEAMEGPVGRQRHEKRLWRRGASLQIAVEFGDRVTPDQADRWRDKFRSSYEGLDGESTAVIGGGGKVTPIGMNLADSAFVELANLTVQDASRIMGVPANLLGVGIQRAVPNLEQDLMTWLRFGLGPELTRIEDAVLADEQLFGAQARGLAPGFDTAAFVRGDLETEDQIAHQQVQDGRLLVDEWRARNGLDPLPDGLGKIPQIVPVGGTPNPRQKPTASADDAPDEGGN
jgi:HK97 family phage portal protein